MSQFGRHGRLGLGVHMRPGFQSPLEAEAVLFIQKQARVYLARLNEKKAAKGKKGKKGPSENSGRGIGVSGASGAGDGPGVLERYLE